MTLVVTALEGIGEVLAGADLADLIGGTSELIDGDIVLVTSKVVSKAEGRVLQVDRDDAVSAESVRIVARRGNTRIVENHLGLVMAAAGVDASNVTAGWVVLLPKDPDASATLLRQDLFSRYGINVAVVVTDTAGRAWRNGQTDIAIGVAGLQPLDDFSGRADSYGNPLFVTAPAVADELAGISEVASGKLGRRPVVIVRGLCERVFSPDVHGPGARALIRPRSHDMFALGAREAVVAALCGAESNVFGAPATLEELREALEQCGLAARPAESGLHVSAPAADATLNALARAHGWTVQRPDCGSNVALVVANPA